MMNNISVFLRIFLKKMAIFVTLKKIAHLNFYAVLEKTLNA